MDDIIPYRDVIENADRRWTTRLLQRLDSPGVPDRGLGEIVEALQMLADPRSFSPLEAVVADPARPARIREAAGAALRGMHHVALHVPAERLRRWWQEGDALLRRHALRSMDGLRCPDIVLKVASELSNPLQADALGRMHFWFDLPHHESIKIAGLSHPDPRVRTVAAEVLLWDEPLAAESPLLQATHDPVPEVATEAANTLEYYPSLRVIRRLHELLGHADCKVREEAEDSFQSIRSMLLHCLSGQDCLVADHVRRWLSPIWEILGFTEEELRPVEDMGTVVPREKSSKLIPFPDLLVFLSDPDSSPHVLNDRLWGNDWPAYGEGERQRLKAVLLRHPDQVVRNQAAWAFAEWGDVGGLLELVEDSDFCVRKSALYNLGRLPPTPGVAELAWDHLNRKDALGRYATETLATFVRHAGGADAVRLLGWVAGDHGRRERLRVAAVHHLARLGAVEEVEQLAGLVREPPEVTWALPTVLLESLVNLGLPLPDIGHLREIDNLHVQVAVARIEA
jgi:HEAT repeat protein